jgi:general secretion pathway protein H
MSQGGSTVPKKSPDTGFNLLELILAVFLIGLVMAVSFPALMNGNSTFRLQATGRDVLSTMRYAREKAISEQMEMLLVVDRAAQKLLLTDDSGSGDRTLQLPQEVKIQRMMLWGQEIREESMMIRFLPNGSSESGELLLESNRGSMVRIFIDPITGSAKLQTVTTGVPQ